MVLRLKTRESRSLPGLLKAINTIFSTKTEHGQKTKTNQTNNAGWSSPVARQAHNLKAAGSNPAPATKQTHDDAMQPKPLTGDEALKVHAILDDAS